MKKIYPIKLAAIIGLALIPANISAQDAEPAKPAVEEKPAEEKKATEATKETLVGTFTKRDDGKVFFKPEEGKQYIVVKNKIEQIGDQFDKKVTAVFKAKVAKDGKTKLIVQINKITPVETPAE